MRRSAKSRSCRPRCAGSPIRRACARPDRKCRVRRRSPHPADFCAPDRWPASPPTDPKAMSTWPSWWGRARLGGAAERAPAPAERRRRAAHSRPARQPDARAGCAEAAGAIDSGAERRSRGAGRFRRLRLPPSSPLIAGRCRGSGTGPDSGAACARKCQHGDAGKEHHGSNAQTRHGPSRWACRFDL